MKTIILAGGMGKRLREVIKAVPKPMAPVGGRPFLEFLILQLLKYSIKDIVLSIGYKAESVRSYFGNGKRWGADIIYSEENEPLGTGGAIRKASELIKDDEFIAMNGDSFLDMDFNRLISCHREKEAFATIGLAYVDNTGRYGRVETGEKGEITGFTEKGFNGPGYINGGVYLFSRKVMHNVPEGNVSLEEDVFPLLLGHGLYGMEVKGFFKDIGIPEDYRSLCNDKDIFARLAGA
ncbi:MAG TPA: nucleotidyltransferase family protein [Candidatus Brocadiaceae bacterium]